MDQHTEGAFNINANLRLEEVKVILHSSPYVLVWCHHVVGGNVGVVAK